MRLAIVQALLTPRQLGQAPLDLLLLRVQALFDAGRPCTAIPHFPIDLCAELDRLLTGIDLSLAPDRFRLALGLLDQKPPVTLSRSHRRDAEDSNCDDGSQRPRNQANHDSDDDEHRPLLLRPVVAGRSVVRGGAAAPIRHSARAGPVPETPI